MYYIFVVLQITIDCCFVGLLLHYIYRLVKPSGSSIIYKEFLEMQDNITELTLELNKISQLTSGDIEKKLGQLKKFVEAADRRIEKIKKAASQGHLTLEKNEKTHKQTVNTQPPSVPQAEPLGSSSQNKFQTPEPAKWASRSGATGQNKVDLQKITEKINPPKPKPLKKKKYLMVTELFAKGKNAKQISELLSMNEGEVQLILNLNNKNL